jgi:hypothetical protein
MPKTKRHRRTKLPQKSTRKTKKVYGADKYVPYTIHKITMISYDPLESCRSLKKIFGNEISDIQTPPDKALKERGIKWIRFRRGGKAEFHFVPPFSLKYTKILTKIAAKQNKDSPLKSQFYENHAGIYVPDLTPIVANALKYKVPCVMNRRADGMYQFYINIAGALDYLDVDSLKFDYKRIIKSYPDFRVLGFADNAKLVKELVSRQDKQTRVHAFTDPNHHGAPRIISIKKDGTLSIIGRDIPGEPKWKIKGKLDKNNDAVLDFSSKGGPKKIKANILPSRVKFVDGNVWKGNDRKLYNLY